jgi:hypothetical protein
MVVLRVAKADERIVEVFEELAVQRLFEKRLPLPWLAGPDVPIHPA